MTDNTLIVFSSDNGGLPGYGGINRPFRAGKGTLYEGGVRVCAFASWPGTIQAGTVVHEPLHVTDWLPTLTRLAGGKSPEQPPLDGRDVWPVLTASAKSPHEEILLNVTPAAGAIRMGKWKLLESGGLSANDPGQTRKGNGPAKVELFDLEADPGEENNLADRQPEMVDKLRARLETYRKAAVPPRTAKEPPGFKAPEIWGENRR
jgi:arylsulfatase A-like enzyme